MPRLCGLILAAGFSSRMGADKALLPWPPANTTGTTLLSSAITSLRPFAEHIVVIAGKNAGNLASIAASYGAFIAVNPAPERGQFSSMQIGLAEALAHHCDAAMITPVDCPPLSESSLNLLLETFENAVAQGQWAVAPEHNGRRGHPLFAARPLIEAFLAAPVTATARDVKHAHPRRFTYLQVPDPYLTVDLNTPDEYAAASALTGHNPPR